MPLADTALRALLLAVKADPEGVDAYSVDMTADEVRAWMDEPGPVLEGHELTDQLDLVQGPVFAEEAEEAFLVIRVRRGR